MLWCMLQIVEQLTEKAVVGARAAVVFLTEEDTRVLLAAVQRAVLSDRLLKHQLVFFGTSTWGDHKDKVNIVINGMFDKEITIFYQFLQIKCKKIIFQLSSFFFTF